MVKKVIKTFEIEYLQVMDTEGKVDESLMPKLSDEQITEMYETMVLCRTFDDKGFNMQRQGRIGTFIQFKGQEASQVGSAYALEEKDWMVPMYRSGAAMITRGFPLIMLYQYFSGDERGMKVPDNINMLPMAIPVGTQSPHVTGLAMASKIKGDGAVALGYTGDGGTSKGDFHDALNFAGVFKSPAIIICENNQFAISVHRKDQTHSETIAQKALAYGIPGIQVDGNDIFAVYKATKEAVDRARAGEGPTLIENYTYRRPDHSTSDDAKKYRSEEEVKEWAAKDPIDRLRKYMMNKGILDDAKNEEIISKAKEKVEKAVEEYEKVSEPDPEDIFKYTYAEMTPNLKEQLEDLKD
ncbi:pyruvate dehydrogenase (acetyl-transferring) E1 component subunit alpha [Candidatus Woesearchaeota archaeon]|nr:pyruvate dehydrogenase (acetyl-transferring) E1 component subunit alpha [Candidatus Woesearchaeota archaeon]